MALSNQVADSMRDAQSDLRNALAFAARSERPMVVSVIADLARLNASLRPMGRDKRIYPSQDLVELLASQSLELSDVPDAGRRIRVARSNNSADPNAPALVRTDIHPSYLEAARQGFEALEGLYFGTMDTVISDRMVPATKDNWVILEVNSSPGETNFHLPLSQGEQPYAPAMIRMLEDQAVSILMQAEEAAERVAHDHVGPDGS